MIYAIGDIHGRRDMLDVALAEIKTQIKPQETVVFLGDYIDRGPDSKGVIEAALAFKAEHENTVFLRGNHEQMCLDTLEDSDGWMWFVNGGKETLESYGGDVSQAHLRFMASTLLEWESERFHFVHAGLVPPTLRSEWGQTSSETLAAVEPRLWIRREFIESDEDFGKRVVFGHTPQRTPPLPLVMANKIGIDTGAVFGKRLTVAVLDDTESDFWYFQVGQDLALVSQPEQSSLLSAV